MVEEDDGGIAAIKKTKSVGGFIFLHPDYAHGLLFYFRRGYPTSVSYTQAALSLLCSRENSG